MPRKENPPLNVPRIKAEEVGSKNSYTDLRAFKRKARETDIGDIPDPTPPSNYPCWCGTSFSKFQSLGGHRSSCKIAKQRAHSPATNQPALPMPNLPQLDLSLSLSPPNSSRSNLGSEAMSNPGPRMMGLNLNMDVTLSPKESDNRDGTELDQDPLELGDMTSSSNAILGSFLDFPLVLVLAVQKYS
ncbi:hypothetical protein MLD38_024872 [Melastoma candidum]|uniref:Uncharacterized protein n=1 Tax=Melastoma candidum TaxID=119954 RepID=A0ACB9NUL0_9MYRT|nr:hypothetical protein MLD38_024872 [Melastoma candidum]